MSDEKVSQQREAGVAGDREIRAALLAMLREIQGRTRIVQEWESGYSRLDVAMIAADAIGGWEIKSDRDSCARLRQQVEDYSGICNTAWVVCGPKIAPKVVAKIPEWWGVIIADGEPLTLRPERPCTGNPRIDVKRTLHRLWSPELHDLCDAHHLPKKVKRSGKQGMIDALHATGRLVELRATALRVLLERTNWREDAA